MKNKLKDLFTRNILLKIGSLFIGLFIWALLSNTQDPITTKTVSVPVTYLNEEKLLVSEKLVKLSGPDTINIVVSVRTSKQKNVKPELFSCTADLIDHNGGDYAAQRVHVNVTQVGGNDVILDWNYARNDPNITVSMDEYIEKTFTIRYLAKDALAEGLMLEGANSIRFDPETVTVSGPRSKFGNVSSVKVVLDLKKLSEGGGGVVSEILNLNLYDANDNVIPNSDGMLKLSDDTVNMTAAVSRMRTVKVIVGGTTGVPAEGNRYVSSSVNPETISVYGLKSNIADFSEVTIPAEDVNIEGIAAERDYLLDITKYLPEGVNLADEDGTVTVHVVVEPLTTERKQISTGLISVNGQSEEYLYSIRDNSISVAVKGFREDLDMLDPAQLAPYIDVTGLAPGIHRVPVHITPVAGYYFDNAEGLSVSISVTENPAYTSSEETEEESEEESETEESEDEPDSSTEAEKESETTETEEPEGKGGTEEGKAG